MSAPNSHAVAKKRGESALERAAMLWAAWFKRTHGEPLESGDARLLAACARYAKEKRK